MHRRGLSGYIEHSSVTITLDRYGHLMPGNEQEAAKLLDGYLARMVRVWPEGGGGDRSAAGFESWGGHALAVRPGPARPRTRSAPPQLETLARVSSPRLADAGARLERHSRREPLALATRAEVGRFVDRLIGVALGFIDEGRQESFLLEVEARCGEPAS
jgi:hypothetical protein